MGRSSKESKKKKQCGKKKNIRLQCFGGQVEKVFRCSENAEWSSGHCFWEVVDLALKIGIGFNDVRPLKSLAATVSVKKWWQ